MSQGISPEGKNESYRFEYGAFGISTLQSSNLLACSFTANILFALFARYTIFFVELNLPAVGGLVPSIAQGDLPLQDCSFKK